jgi:anti-sigma B factor antagonist
MLPTLGGAMGIPDLSTFAVSMRTGADNVVIDLDGEFDMSEVEAFRICFDGVVASSGGDVVIDLTDVTFIDSTAIQALLNARRCLAEQGRDVRLQHFTSPVARVLDLAGLASVLVDSAVDRIEPFAD